jgi:hypothetical protein
MSVSDVPFETPDCHPHDRATSVWYRTVGLRAQRNQAVEIIEAEIRSAQREVLLEAAKLVLGGRGPREIARKLQEMAEETIRPTGRAT